MSTIEGTTMHPRCRHIGACWDLHEWFHLFGTSQNISQVSISKFKNNNQIFMFPCYSTRKDLSIDVSITIVGLILTKLGWFQLFGTSQNSISNFLKKKKKKKISFHGVVGTHEDLSIDVSITNVGLILTKLWWFQLFSTSQNSNFELLWKKNQIFGFPCWRTREDISIDVSITNVGLILTKLWWFQLYITSQNSNFEFKKKLNFWVFML